jgi:hypothetical protein
MYLSGLYSNRNSPAVITLSRAVAKAEWRIAAASADQHTSFGFQFFRGLTMLKK